MKENYYNENMQKLLYMVKVLHERGYERLRVIPSLSSTGLAWRCRFIANENLKDKDIFASSWIYQFFEKVDVRVELSINELANLFEREHLDFLSNSKGENRVYVLWYKNMLDSLEIGELPFAFADYFSPTDYWETTSGNKIYTLANEKDYYFSY